VEQLLLLKLEKTYFLFLVIFEVGTMALRGLV
jgi:hypothetical protein